MNAEKALHLLAENALNHADEDLAAKLPIYDALAVIARMAGLSIQADAAAATAAALRGAETIEMEFRRRLVSSRDAEKGRP